MKWSYNETYNSNFEIKGFQIGQLELIFPPVVTLNIEGSVPEMNIVREETHGKIDKYD